jgi:hypothetical protein
MGASNKEYNEGGEHRACPQIHGLFRSIHLDKGNLALDMLHEKCPRLGAYDSYGSDIVGCLKVFDRSLSEGAEVARGLMAEETQLRENVLED